jgi:alpha-glucosidase (family GH31 glycosyl hydrolase)
VFPDTLTLGSTDAKVILMLRPHFGMTVAKADGSAVLRTLADDHVVNGDALGAYVPLGATHRDTEIVKPLLDGLEGFDHAEATDQPWLRATNVVSATSDAASAHVVLADPKEPSTTLAIDVSVNGTSIDVTVTTTANRTDAKKTLNLFGQSFASDPDEKFVGFGEHENAVNHRGERLKTWVEEGGLGGGEKAPPSEFNPFPNGPGMTHVPMPFYISSRGYGLWIRTSFRTEFSLGNDDPGAIRIAAEEAKLSYRIYVHDAPRQVLADFTADSGRAQLPAPWVFGPRRRMDTGKLIKQPGGDVLEAQLMRDRSVPTTCADDTTHFLPNNGSIGREVELKAWTAQLHSLGYKANGYFNGHVSAERPEAAALLSDGRAKNVFVKLDDGTESQVRINSAGWQKVATLDLTNPVAVTWFEGQMANALALGYDGWMLDFGEYLPQHAKLANGMSGWEAHNLYPIFLQTATTDYLRRVRGDDYLIFVRSGYVGTQAHTSVVWSGDPSASFDNARGLPAMVRSGINAGLSGIPFWGSDISGFTCVSGDPADKELYLRWAEFGALSSDMHDENACAGKPDGAPEKWTLWSDDETVSVYGRYASLHTRLFPYLYATADEAVATGMPVIRHPLLINPELPDAWSAEHSYWFGPSLYVAPVVRRGDRNRTFWLPPGTWFDWWTLAAAQGGANVTRDVPLDTLPLYFKAGSIVVMLPEEVQTLVSTDNPSVIDMSDVDGTRVARVGLTAAAPNAEAKTHDGATFTSALQQGALTLPADIPAVTTDAELHDCARCGRIDALPDGTKRVRITATGVTAQAGALTLSASRPNKSLRVRWDVLVH